MAVPVLARVTVCEAEALPTRVVAKVRELSETVYATRGAMFDGATR